MSAIMVASGLLVLMGVGALCVDVGRVQVAAQRTQDVVDAAAFSAGPLLIQPNEAIATALMTAQANNTGQGPFAVRINHTGNGGQSDIEYYPPGSTLPGMNEPLGMFARAIRVTGHIDMPYTFGRAIGLDQVTVTRSATVIRAPAGGAPIAPIWVAHGTDYNYGQYQNLLMADGPHYSEIPGSFGFLQIPSGLSVSWREVLAGIRLTDYEREAMFVDISDSVYAYTGLNVGQWTTALNERITHAGTGKWAGETFDNCSDDNPRILIVPLVTYKGGTGSNARFEIIRFGAFWLDDVSASGNPKRINGRFIQYTLPGAGTDALSEDQGLFTFRLVS